MASLCKRQQCTVERRGFRQELDSWRHKLIHCVGFESILEGLFGQGLVEDLKLFKAFEPKAVSDWSFDENCLFCCLRRDKVKEHLVGLSNQGLEDTPKPLLLNDQTKINRLERQAEEFLKAVLCRKGDDVPSFSDPHIPVVAREIMQRMIRQFAAEYTSKNSSSQDPLPDPQPCFVQSLPHPPSFPPVTPSTSPSGAALGASSASTAAAHNQNPVLSKLLMADQEAPLDLTVKKPKAEPTEQDGVLDLSLRKNRFSSSLLVHSPYPSPNTSTVKGESSEIHISKAKELQSTSTLEQFMAKLCLHHQRQIVDALGFLQTEVKALASQAPCHTSDKQETTPSVMTSSLSTCEKSSSELRLPSASTHNAKGISLVIFDNPTTSTIKEVPGEVVSLKPINPDPCLSSATTLVNSTPNTADPENNRDHGPLKMKIMKTNKLADGKKLSFVLTTSLLTQTDTVEERQANSGSNSSNKVVSQSARLSSPVKRHSQPVHVNRDGYRDSLGKTKDAPSKLFSPHKTSNTHHTDTPRTARKTIRDSPDHRQMNTGSRVVIDPDLGNCDIVYINKPITECLREQHGHLPPRRNARKSTRGHMYVEEMWELKTVRTLAGRSERSNCPNPIPEIITLVTPKQALTKPDGVPPLDMNFVGGCGETCQQMPMEQSDVREMPGTGDAVEAATTQLNLIVETSQTDQSKSNEPAASQFSLSASTENGEKEAANAEVVQDATSNSMHTTESDLPKENDLSKEIELPKESYLQEENDLPEEGDLEEIELPEGSDLPEDQTLPKRVEKIQGIIEVLHESTEQQITQVQEQIKADMVEEAETVLLPESIVPEQQQMDTLPSLADVADAVEEEVREQEGNGNTKVEQSLEPKLEAPKLSDNLGTGLNSQAAPAENITKGQQIDVIAPIQSVVKHSAPVDEDDEYDVSTKSLESLLKELPPWRRKRGTVISLPKRLKETQSVIVGYVNGRPISASDRSLRRRSSTGPPTPTKATEKPSHSVSENSPLTNHIPETIAVIKSENSAVVPQETEPIPAVPRTPVTQHKRLSKSYIKRHKKKSEAIVEHDQQQTDVLVVHENAPAHLADEPVDIPQHTPPKLPLCSANQQLPETTESPITSNAVTFPSPTSPISIPSADVVQLLPDLPDAFALPPSVVSPPSPVTSAPPVTSEQSKQCTDSEHAVELSSACGQSVATSPMEIQEMMMENVLLNKQKEPWSEKCIDSMAEKQKVCHQVSSPLESQSGICDALKMQNVPLTIEKTLQKDEAGELDEMPNVCLLDESLLEDSNTASVLEKPARMPLRSESSKAEMANQSLSPQPAENMKLALRSQRSATPSTSAINVGGRQKQMVSPIRRKPVISGSLLQPSTVTPFILQPREPRKQAVHKLFETLNGEDNQHLITNLNIKFDRMQKGWIQLDKEGQPATKYRNKADRQAAIWKSKRRTRKPKSLEQHKYSPVQMLFMKNFNLTSICQWFLESTETKSLVIVKKVNTRLPSETQLCFHSSSSGSSQGVFPSLQAERLKKHLKKFAVASPIKNNPKGQKLIAKALEQEAIKGKDKKEHPIGNQALTMPFSTSAKTQGQIGEPHKVSNKSKNPASARILRKYSNIREKMQVQQTSIGLKETTKSLKCSTFKTLTPSKSASKPDLKSTLKRQKSALPEAAHTRVYKPTASKATPDRKSFEKPTVTERAVKNSGSSRAPRDPVKESVSPQRCSQRLGSPKTLKNLIEMSTSKVNSNKIQLETEKKEVEKSPLAKQSSAKSSTKEPVLNRVSEGETVETIVEITQQNMDLKTQISPDQVLTRSQRKMEAVNVSPALKKSLKLNKSRSASVSKNAPEAVMTRRGTLKSVGKNGLTPSPSRSVKKLPTKRSSEPLETPVKRTRMSQLK
ncbi:unnamed protein product [Merluccius merluccius]